jgi:hypothetical protein
MKDGENSNNAETKDKSLWTGYKNRHVDGLPAASCDICILAGGEEFRGRWVPYSGSHSKRGADNLPYPGYLGTVKVDGGEYKGADTHIGFHAWAQDDDEFVFYREV